MLTAYFKKHFLCNLSPFQLSNMYYQKMYFYWGSVPLGSLFLTQIDLAIDYHSFAASSFQISGKCRKSKWLKGPFKKQLKQSERMIYFLDIAII